MGVVLLGAKKVLGGNGFFYNFAVLSKEIINLNESIIIEKELTKENAETKDSLEKDKTFELDELSIWKKAEEKLEKALN